MGVFVDYLINSFQTLNSTPTTILTATDYKLTIRKINICNLGAYDIRINLELMNAASETIVLAKNILIHGSENKDNEPNFLELASHIGLCKTLQLTESLVCYSNGPTQKFSCNVDYAQINELF